MARAQARENAPDGSDTSWKNAGLPAAPEGPGGIAALDGFAADCVPVFFLDGAETQVPYGDISFLVRPEEIEGIEVYTSVNAPAQFRRGVTGFSDSSCGVIVIWTRYTLDR